MHNLFTETALTKLQQSHGQEKLFYGLLVIVSFFFVAGTLYTTLTTIRLLATLNPFPAGLLLFTAVYVLMQLTLAYGLFTARRWITYALLSHTAIIIVTALILLPLFELSTLTKNTLLGAIPLALRGSSTYFRRKLLHPSRIVLPTLLYTLLISVSLALNVMIYVYSPA